MATKKAASKTGKKSPKPQRTSTWSSIKLGKNELRIKYSDGHDLQDKLLSAAQSLSRLHTHLLLANASGANIKGGPLNHVSLAGIDDLGPQAAFEIVTKCAGETDITQKLGDIPGLDPVIFQSCVQSGVISAGFKPGSILASTGTTLWQVIQAIEGSSK